jgi:phage I-like protein
MISTAFLTPLPIALNRADAEQDGVPEWIQLTPEGPRLPGNDGRVWTMADAEAVIATCRAARGSIEIPVDFEHATHVKGARGERADAAGWVRELDARGGAIWGRVEWNDAGREAIASRGYRFISPGFEFHKVTGAVRRIVSAGLTNLPNFTMPALNREGELEETEMDAAVLKALGLNSEASAADAVVAITTLKRDAETALNRAASPDPAQFVPRADYDIATNRVSDLEKQVAEARNAEIEAEIDAAVEAGKIAPSSRDYHLAVCRSEGGLEQFRSFVGQSPVIAPDKRTAKTTTTAKTDKDGLNAEELAVCRQMGMSPADFAAAKAADQE